jgi:hypothetical protein
MLAYLTSIHLAANAVALLTGGPLAERRFLLQFPARAAAAGQPDLAEKLLGLLGANQVDAATLMGFLPEWERTFIEAANSPTVERQIAAARLGYYKLAFESMLASEMPQAVVWPLILTWTLSVSALPPVWRVRWKSACETLGLEWDALEEKLAGLDHFLDSLEEMLENMTTSQGL